MSKLRRKRMNYDKARWTICGEFEGRPLYRLNYGHYQTCRPDLYEAAEKEWKKASENVIQLTETTIRK